MPPSDETLHKRIERLRLMLLELDEPFDLLGDGRRDSEAGFAPTNLHPCQHPLRARRGKLCLLCDNTGWRRAYPDEEPRDPYEQRYDKMVVCPSCKKQHRESVDECNFCGTSLRMRTMEPRAIDAELKRLRELELVREGKLAEHDPHVAVFFKALKRRTTQERRNRGYAKLRFELDVMRIEAPDLYEELPDSYSALKWLAQALPAWATAIHPAQLRSVA